MGVLSNDEAIERCSHVIFGRGGGRPDAERKKYKRAADTSRAKFVRELDAEKGRLSVLASIIDKLEDGACLALLTRVEEVYAGEGDNLYGRCVAVHQKMQSRSRL